MKCARCQSPNPMHANFCSACGARLAGAAPIEGERRHLTVLFCDLVGSTEIAARLDPEQWHEIAARYQRASAAAVTKFGGHVGKYLGDGLVAYFGYPEALEDAAERAVHAGLGIVAATQALNESDGKAYGVTLAVRVGLHAGSVVVGQGGGPDADMFGDAPNIASRVQAAAAPGTVIMTPAVHDAVSGMFLVESLGAHRLKGVERPMPLFRAVRAGLVRRRAPGGSSRRRSPFAGRVADMRVLTEHCQRARSGNGQVVLIMGEAGIGKSRMLAELRASLVGEPHLWIECAGEPLYDNTPLRAVAQLFDQGLGWRGEELKEARAEQVKQVLAAAGLNAAESFPALAELFGLPAPDGADAVAPEENRKRLLEGLTALVLGAARAQLVVLVVEDLHWIDPSTLELLEVLAERSHDAKLLLVGTARPEFRAPWPMRSHHAQITLGRLDKHQIHQMVAPVISEGGLQLDIVAGVVERADGVPLFAEELARLMLDTHGSAGAHAIPETLQDSLTARIDRLGSAKETAQIGAVLGREFSYRLLRALSPLTEKDLQTALARLVESDLIDAEGVAPNALYRFKHSLVQDAAYEALLKRQRRVLHGRAAQALGDEFAALAESHPAILAYHCAEAGETDKALDAWTKAAKSAAARYAYKESADAFERAIATLESLPETQERDGRALQLWRWFVGVAQIAYGYSAAETRKATQTARELAEKTGDVRKKFAHIAGEWMAASSAGEHRASRKLAQQILHVALAQATPDGLATAHMVMLTSRFRLGDLVGAETSFAAGEPFFNAPDFVRRPGAAAQAFGNAAMNAWVRGDVAEVRRRIAYVRAVAEKSDNPYEQAFSLYMVAMVALMLEDFEEAESFARRSIGLSTEGRFPQFAATSSIVLGRVLAQVRRPEHGLPLLLEGLQGMTRNRSRTLLTMYLTWLAATYAADGAAEQAEQTLEQALTINPQEKFFRPEGLRLRGELLAKAGDRHGAADQFRRAVNLAGAMRADVLRARALTSQNAWCSSS